MKLLNVMKSEKSSENSAGTSIQTHQSTMTKTVWAYARGGSRETNKEDIITKKTWWHVT